MTASIPFDNTIPQQSEGTELMTVTVTPQHAGSKLLIQFDGWFTEDSVAAMTLAVFRDAGADAILCRGFTAHVGSGHAFGMMLRGYVDAGTAGVAQTLKVRVGVTAGNLGFLCSPDTTAYFDGTDQAVFTVTEIKQ